MQQLGMDLTHETVPEAPQSDKTFFGLHLYLAEKYCENPNVPGAQLNVTMYYVFFSWNNSPPPRKFLCKKILLKKN